MKVIIFLFIFIFIILSCYTDIIVGYNTFFSKCVKINNSTIDDEKLLITNNLFDSKKTLRLSLGKKRHIKVELF